jgi:hypothetical protein
LKSIDRLAHKDPAFKTFVTQLVTKLEGKIGQLDVIAYSQFFEIYGEAVTLQFLRSRTGLKTERVPEAREGRPDFRCELENGRVFHIEVKSLDVVSGEFRQREMACTRLRHIIMNPSMAGRLYGMSPCGPVVPP